MDTVARVRPIPLGPSLTRGALLLVGAAGVAGLALVAAVALGSVGIDPAQTLAILARRLLGLPLAETWPTVSETIVMELRLPRALAALLVGGGLASAGAVFQALLRNPMADPYVIGTAAGASLGAVLGIVGPLLVPALALGAGSAWLGIGLVQALAFGGGVLTVLAVVGLARGSSPVVGLLLTGYAVSSLLSAVVALLLFGAGRALGAVVAWLLGSLAGAGWSDLAVAGPLLGMSFIGLLLHWRSLNLLLMGDEAATHLGLDVRRTRLRLVLLASLSASAAVAVSGTIGFVGLVVPHLVRLLSGPDHRLLLPLSALLGGALLTVADLGVRLAGGVPVGVATALIGAPFLLWLLSRSRRSGGAAWPSA